MIELKLGTTDFFGAEVATCMVLMFDSWVNHSGDLRIVVDSSTRNVLTLSLEGEEYELELDGMPRAGVMDWALKTLGVLRHE